MSVFTNEQDDFYNSVKNKTSCSVCGYAVQYPFMHWNDIFICSHCAPSIKQGFMADLIHLAALADLRALGYHLKQPLPGVKGSGPRFETSLPKNNGNEKAASPSKGNGNGKEVRY